MNKSKFLQWESLVQLATQVKNNKVSASQLVQRSLDAIEEFSEYNSLITVCGDEALAKAKIIDDDKKKTGRLAGVPFIVKDNYLTSGIETTAGSNILKGYIPPYTATAVARLEAEGAILVGKANLDAFAHGSSTENSDFGPTLNPHDKQRVPGGSSGGSAAAVALGLAPFALGSDTGGSIRLPAAYCGVVGLKPTYGLVPRYGVVAMASSTDCMGPLTTSAADASLILDIIAGSDDHDSTTVSRQKNYQSEGSDLSGLKFGVIKQHMSDGVSSEVKSKVNQVIDKLKSSGATVTEVNLPSVDLALAVYYIVVPAEVSSNLSRYDGVRYGLSSIGANNLDELYEVSRSEGFNIENKRRIMMGTFVLSSGYYDAYYKKAQTVRTKIINEFNTVFRDVDFLIGPTAPSVAFKIGENVKNPLQMYLSDVMTVAANLTGIPAISLPAGKSNNQLPVGVQVMAQQNQDAELLSVAQTLEGVIHA